ncbi:MAG: FAD-binding oxidoreductase, partial [Acidimicrobiales bacterium]
MAPATSRKGLPPLDRRLDPRLAGELAEVVGRPHVLDDPEVVVGYSVDWSGRFRGVAAAVVRPGTTAEVAAVVAACRRYGTALVPQGGNTGLAGGGVPLHGEVVLSLRRLSSVGEVDDEGGQVTAGAGATIGQVRRAASAAGWDYGIDLASRDSATVGGTVGTNAGGLAVLRYGDTRAQVAGVEAVLGTGETISHLGGLVKDNTGYALAPLLCGSEGTLAVVTAVRLRLVPAASARVVALLAFDGAPGSSGSGGPASSAGGPTQRAVRAALYLRRRLASLLSAELMLDSGVDLVCRATGIAPPFPGRHAAYLLVEAAGPTDPATDLADAVAAVDGVAGVAVATEPSPALALRRYREAHTEAIGT